MKRQSSSVRPHGTPISSMASRTKISGDRIELVSIRVALLLDAYRIEGNIYVAPELRRFSDAWESLMRDPRGFIPVSDAHITGPGGASLEIAPFMQVRKNDVRGVFPTSKAAPPTDAAE